MTTEVDLLVRIVQSSPLVLLLFVIWKVYREIKTGEWVQKAHHDSVCAEKERLIAYHEGAARYFRDINEEYTGLFDRTVDIATTQRTRSQERGGSSQSD